MTQFKKFINFFVNDVLRALVDVVLEAPFYLIDCSIFQIFGKRAFAINMAVEQRSEEVSRRLPVPFAFLSESRADLGRFQSVDSLEGCRFSETESWANLQ
ncbi:hypothetical protein D3C76_1447980 [compost metagenome]